MIGAAVELCLARQTPDELLGGSAVQVLERKIRGQRIECPIEGVRLVAREVQPLQIRCHKVVGNSAAPAMASTDGVGSPDRCLQSAQLPNRDA